MTSVHALGLVAVMFLTANTQPAKSVGSLLMLANGGLTATDLGEALAHQDPLMRMVGARLITVNRISVLVPTLKAAGEKESDPRVSAEIAESLRLLALKPERPLEPSVAPPRIPRPWLPGQLARAAEAAGCQLADGQFGVAEVTYAADGRPVRINLKTASALSKECSAVLTVMARTTLLDRFDIFPEGTIQWLVVPFSKAYAECTREIGIPAPPTATARARPPRLIRHVRPDYPPDLLDKRIEGTVVAVGIVSGEGCVQDLAVKQGVALGLDLAALQAMSGWLFEVPQIDGKPQPAPVELTVKFTAR